MTAIYAFASKHDQFAFIVSDNVEINSRKKVDKVFLLENRFAIAVFGQDVAVHAIEAMVRFEKCSNFVPFGLFKRIIQEMGRNTKAICERLYPMYLKKIEEGEIAEKDWDQVLNNTLNIVVLDCSTYSLYQADFGYPFPPEKLFDKPKSKVLTGRWLHLFALAQVVTGSSQEDIDISSLKDDPYGFMQDRINQDKLKNQQIGNLGASIVVREGKLEVRSCFSDPLDFIKETYDRIRSSKKCD